MESPCEKVEAQLILGGAALLAKARQLLGAASRREQPGARALRRRDFEEVVGVISRLKGEAWESFRDRHGDWGHDLAFMAGPRLLRAQAHRTWGACGRARSQLGERRDAALAKTSGR